jgi:hypothetical protein
MKTKPFNIDEAKRTLRAVTLAGEPVRLFAFDLKGAYPILGAISVDGGKNEYTARWTLAGRSTLGGSSAEDCSSDLRSPVETVTRYINIYRRADSVELRTGPGVFVTHKDAEDCAGHSQFAVVEIKIELP